MRNKNRYQGILMIGALFTLMLGCLVFLGLNSHERINGYLAAAITLYVFAACAFTFRYHSFYRAAIRKEEELLRLFPDRVDDESRMNVFPIGLSQWISHFSVGIVNVLVLIFIIIALAIY